MATFKKFLKISETNCKFYIKIYEKFLKILNIKVSKSLLLFNLKDDLLLFEIMKILRFCI